MSRVTGLGGIFFKAKNPDSLRNWYSKHLELPIEDWGGMTYRWRETDQPEREGTTVWSVFPASSKYFDPSAAETLKETSRAVEVRHPMRLLANFVDLFKA